MPLSKIKSAGGRHGLMIFAAGCRSANPRTGQTGVLHDPVDVTVNREQLRLRVRSLVGPMTGRMESAADEIAASTASQTVRLAALEWKIDAVPAMRDSLFQPDPYVALIDTWVLLYQMSDYFERGPGKTRLGPASALAAVACRTSEDHLAGVAASATTSGDVSKVREFVRKWAAEHPITETVAARQPILSIDVENEIRDSLTVGQAVAEVAISLDDLNRRLDVYSGQLVRQARWELERQTLSLLDDLSAKEAIPLAERAVASAEQATAEIHRLDARRRGGGSYRRASGRHHRNGTACRRRGHLGGPRPYDRVRAARTACGPRVPDR